MNVKKTCLILFLFVVISASYSETFIGWNLSTNPFSGTWIDVGEITSTNIRTEKIVEKTFDFEKGWQSKEIESNSWTNFGTLESQEIEVLNLGLVGGKFDFSIVPDNGGDFRIGLFGTIEGSGSAWTKYGSSQNLLNNSAEKKFYNFNVGIGPNFHYVLSEKFAISIIPSLNFFTNELSLKSEEFSNKTESKTAEISIHSYGLEINLGISGNYYVYMNEYDKHGLTFGVNVGYKLGKGSYSYSDKHTKFESKTEDTETTTTTTTTASGDFDLLKDIDFSFSIGYVFSF